MSTARGRSAVARTVTAKILEDHLAGGRLDAGQEIAVRVDQTLLQDATGTMACLQFEQLGLDRVRVPLAVPYVPPKVIPAHSKKPAGSQFTHAFFAQPCS